MKKLIPAMLMAAAPFFALAQTDGFLDASFGNNGFAQNNLGYYEQGRDVAVLPNGKILVLNEGSGPNGAQYAFLLQYTADGAPDPSFGDNGVAQVDHPEIYPKALSLLPDGKIAVIGTAYASFVTTQILVFRFKENGTKDTSFGQDGVASVNIPISTVNAIDVLPNGKLLVGGMSYDDNFDSQIALARLQPGGAVDLSFNFDGLLTTAGTPPSVCEATAGQPDGKILAGGGSGGYGYGEFTLMRFLSNGTVDSTFGAAGKTVTIFGANEDYITALLLQPDGKIVAGGIYHKTPDNSEFALVRYKPDGTTDNSFGINGKVITKIGNYNDNINALALQPDGKIVAIGEHHVTQYTESRIALIRYQSNGQRDSSFGVDGIALTQLSALQAGNAAALQPNGQLLVTGSVADSLYIGSDVFVARYLTTLNVGVLDATPGVHTSFIYPNPLTAATLTVEYALREPLSVGFELYSLDGLQHWRLAEQPQQAGAQKTELTLPPALSPGEYVLCLRTAAGSAAVRLVKL